MLGDRWSGQKVGKKSSQAEEGQSRWHMVPGREMLSSREKMKMSFQKIRFYLFIFRERGRREKERKRNIDRLLLTGLWEPVP